VLYWIKEYNAIILKREKLVARPARHYLINSTTADIFITFEVNGAEIEAYACERDKPTSACFKAPQSFAPSPHIITIFFRCWYKLTILALSFGLALA
jgi:hypothetical protein